MLKIAKSYLIITVGTLLMTLGVYLFEFPNRFSTGGVSGIAIILGDVVRFLTPAQIVVILNVFLLIVGFLILGKSFGVKTIYASLLMSVTLNVPFNIGYPCITQFWV